MGILKWKILKSAWHGGEARRSYSAGNLSKKLAEVLVAIDGRRISVHFSMTRSHETHRVYQPPLRTPHVSDFEGRMGIWVDFCSTDWKCTGRKLVNFSAMKYHENQRRYLFWKASPFHSTNQSNEFWGFDFRKQQTKTSDCYCKQRVQCVLRIGNPSAAVQNREMWNRMKWIWIIIIENCFNRKPSIKSVDRHK